MKRLSLYACILALTLLSSVSFGDIDSVGGGDDWYSSYASASASGSYTYDEDDESGWHYVYTTEADWFAWVSEVSADAIAEVDADPFGIEWATADAYASASATGCSAFANASADNSTPSDDDSDDDWAYGVDYFSAYEGVGGDHTALAIAEIEEFSENSASAGASANAYADMG